MISAYAQSLIDKSDRKSAARSGAAQNSKPSALASAKTVLPRQSTATAAAPIVLPAALAAYPIWMTAKQVGEYLAISEDQVMLFRDEGEMEFLRVSTPGVSHPSWRISRVSVHLFEQRRQVACTA
jgi:hypothetical protein